MNICSTCFGNPCACPPPAGFTLGSPVFAKGIKEVISFPVAHDFKTVKEVHDLIQSEGMEAAAKKFGGNYGNPAGSKEEG